MALVPRLRKPGIVVEKELAMFKEQAKTFPQRHKQLAAIRYYLHFALWECQRHWRERHRGITNYSTLLDEIERWRSELFENVCFVTFNYDTMLEEAMQEVLRFEVRDLRSYLSQKNYTLIKLHGSINWGRELDQIVAPHTYNQQTLIESVADLKISDRYRVVSDYPMLRVGDKLVFPALSIPVENKDEFSCPAEHVQALTAVLPKVTKILTVGWRATEADFLKMLEVGLKGGESAPSLMIVSGDQKGAEETSANLKRTQGAFMGHMGSMGFTGLVNNIGWLDGLLRATPSN